MIGFYDITFILTVFVTIEVSTFQVLPVTGVSCPEWRMFEPAVLVSFMEGERSATLVLFCGTSLSTVSPTPRTEVPNIGSPVIDIVLGTYLEGSCNVLYL